MWAKKRRTNKSVTQACNAEKAKTNNGCSLVDGTQQRNIWTEMGHWVDQSTMITIKSNDNCCLK